jgi:hypothetical protein
MEPEFLDLYRRCRAYTMTSLERMYALYGATAYLARNGIPGDVVECGVWRGGSSMLAAMTLARLGAADRCLYLYDTFAGMTEPTSLDTDHRGRSARDLWRRAPTDGARRWFHAPVDEVRRNMALTGYPAERIVYVVGKVEETIPATVPERIALLRLDTDWFESTYHEMVHLLPRLAAGGVLVLDDYGHWQGARRAIDRYFEEAGIRPFLQRIDYTGRMAVNTWTR